MKYDYIIVGSGLFGAVCAYELNKLNKKVIVLEKRKHIGGNCYTETKDNINIHKYGPHIFHTSNEDIWKYMQQFTTFNNFSTRPVAKYKNEIYSLPFNMWTFNQMWGVITPEEAREKMLSQTVSIENPKNLEEQALKTVGRDVYEKLIKGYVKKQWRKPCDELPASIIKRLPVRFTYDNNYYFDNYQGIPIGGYTRIFEKMLSGIEIELDTDYLQNKTHWNQLGRKVIYTGPIDRYFEYVHGDLEYKTTEFETERHEIDDYQGVFMVSYTEEKIPYTRIIEHKHFEETDSTGVTWTTKEYPVEFTRQTEPYYPVNDARNTEIYKKYQNLANELDNVYFGGRLAEYKYYDMDKVVASALKFLTKLENEKQ